MEEEAAPDGGRGVERDEVSEENRNPINKRPFKQGQIGTFS